MRVRVAGALLVAAGSLLVSACTAGEAPPAPPVPPADPVVSTTPTPQLPNRDFTVGTTDAITTVDPAAMTIDGSEAIAHSVFQRLMTTPAGSDLLKPDAARDCIFEQATVYTCTLKEGLRFHSGEPVTSADVKYSLERAIRLDVAGSSTPQLASISSIQTPDELTVRFVLAFADTQVGHALASPAASIVDPAVYAADAVAAADIQPSGSGPYRHMASGDGVWTFARYESYRGSSPAGIVRAVVQEYPGSAELEQALIDGDVDVAWHGLDEAALTRQSATATAQEEASTYVPVVLVGARVARLEWAPDSPAAGDQATRAFVNEALATRRTLTSIMPVQVEGAREGLYPAGGVPAPTPPGDAPVALVLGHDAAMADGADRAAELARTLQQTGQVTVTVQASEDGADLRLVDARAATWTPRAWLQAATGIESSPKASEIDTIMTGGLTSADDATREAAIATLQDYVAEDAYVVPLAQADGQVFVRRGYSLDPVRLGPGWQLDLAAFSRPS